MKLLGRILAAPAAVVGVVALVLTAVVLTTPQDETPTPARPERHAQSENTVPPADEPDTTTSPKPAAAYSTAGSTSVAAQAPPSGARPDEASRSASDEASESAPDEPAKGPKASDPETKTYVVKPGDTPAAIAQQQLGDASLWPEIARANPGLEARSLQIGQILRLPGSIGAAAARVQAGTPTQKPAASPEAQGTSGAALAIHRVAQGDSLYQLARRYYGDASRWTLIRDANPALQASGVKGLRLDSELIIPAPPGPGR